MLETTSRIMSAGASRVVRVFKRAVMGWGKPSSSRLGHALALIFIFSAASLCLALFLSPPLPTGSYHVFGPEDFVRAAGQPVIETRTFTVARPGEGFLLRIHNGGSAGQFGRASSAQVKLNQTFVAKSSDFNQQVGLIERHVALAADNTLSVKIAGSPGSGLTVEIYGFDHDQPTITATAQPSANAAGWNNTDVTVAFDCADQTSGIASCTPPINITTEGASQTVNGTATDRAGNTASAAFTLNVDKTPPTLAIGSPTDGATLDVADVTVAGMVGDNLSGVAGVTCNGIAAVLSGPAFTCDLHLNEGANIITAQAADNAGNTRTAVISVAVDTAIQTTAVPDVSGATHAASVSAINAVGLDVGEVTTAHSAAVPSGRVIGQNPPAGTNVPTGSAVDLVLSLGAEGATPPISFTVDPSVVPDSGEVRPLEDGLPRRLASVVDARGNQTDFVENELMIVTNDDAAVTAFVARWQGQILRSINPSPTRLPGLSRMYLVRINPSLADPAALVADLRAFTTVGQGEHRVTNETGLGLLAAAQMENAGGLRTTPNWIFQSQDFINRTTTEDTNAPSPFVGRDGVNYGNNAFNWPYMNRLSRGGGVQDIGVADAWRALAQTNRLGHRVEVMIADSGFHTTNQDLPGSPATYGQINEAGPGSCPNAAGVSSPCPWHGDAVLEAGMAMPDNSFGVAGPGGPVSDLILLGSPSLDLFQIVEYVVDAVGSLTEGPDIINMSFGFRLSASLAGPPDELLSDIAAVFRLSGTLLIAAAGNANQDVDGEDCALVCWEEAAYLPCETNGVMCVGGLAFDSISRAKGADGTGNSNFGSQPDDCCTVDIYAPYHLWLATNPQTGTQGVTLRQGTSYSAPFVAGVAALVWAANPNLSDGEVEDILIRTAHTSSRSDVPRWVNAYGAVLEALPNDPPFIRVRTQDGRSCPAPNQPNRVCVSRGTSVTFTATVNDTEDQRNLDIAWVSDRDGPLGTSTIITVNNLSFGEHIITATATDTGGVSETDSIVVSVENDQPPHVEITGPADRAVFQQGQDIVLSGVSSDPNNPPNFTLTDGEVIWRLDGSGFAFASGHNATLAGGATPGMHLITFTGIDVRNGANHSASDIISVMVQPNGPLPGQPPAVSITSPADGARFVPREVANLVFAAEVTLTGEAFDPEDGALPARSLIWTTRRNGNAEETLGLGNSLTTILHTDGLTVSTEHLITLYATDSDGHVSSRSILVLVVFPDADGDGLSIADETRLGTNPDNVDTDADGVWDGAEVFLATDPNSAASEPADIPARTLFAATSGFPGGAALTMIDPATGNHGVLGRPPGVLGNFGLAFGEAASPITPVPLYISVGQRLMTYDPLSGATNEVGPYTLPGGAGISVLQIAYHRADRMLYGIEEGSAPDFRSTGQLVRINPATAQAERVGDGTLNPRLNALTFSYGGVLFGVAERVAPDTSDRLVEIDPATGLVVRDAGPFGSATIFGLTFHGGGLLAGRFVANDEGQLLTVNTNSGAGAHLSTVARPVFGMTVKPCIAPCTAPPSNVTVGGSLTYVETADMDGDGLLDVVTADSAGDRVVLLRGNGNGTFQPPSGLPVGDGPETLAVADLNGDGRLDIVSGNRPARDVSVLLNDGAGGFLPATNFPAGGTAPATLTSLAAGDFTGDQIVDIAASVSRSGDNSISLLVGDGAGGFGAPQPIYTSTNVIVSLAAGNLNRDAGAGGLPNLDVVAVLLDGNVVVLFGNGAGGFPLTTTQRLAFGPSGITLGDLNRDGWTDVVIPDFESLRALVSLNDGAGNLLPITGHQVGPQTPPRAARIADLTGEGRPDIATANNSGSVSVLLGNPGGGFTLSFRSPIPLGASPRHLAVGDLNGDGWTDMVTANSQGSISVLLNDPPF